MDRNVSNIKERILYFTDIKGLSKEFFFTDLGTTYGSFKGKAKNQGLNSDIIERIVTKYPEINLEWLLTGNGEMLKNNQTISGNNNKTIASNINGNNITVSHNEIENLIEIEKKLLERLKESQSQLSVSQEQINQLIVIIKNSKL